MKFDLYGHELTYSTGVENYNYIRLNGEIFVSNILQCRCRKRKNMMCALRKASQPLFFIFNHQFRNHFHTQPSGNSGEKIACGEIRQWR